MLTPAGTRRHTVGLILVAFLVFSSPASAAETILFSAIHDVRATLLQRLRAETVRIDMSAWYLSEHEISLALVERFNAGVEVRLIGDRVAIFESDPLTRREFFWLASQGIPIRLRYEPTSQPEPAHWKATIFAGQNLVTFGSGNYTPFELAPVSATNYKDETALFSDDTTLVNGFRTKFDRMWNDRAVEPGSIAAGPPYLKNWNDACALESACAEYYQLYLQPRVMVVNTARLEPDYPMPPDVIWSQGAEFNQRLVTEIARETVRVDLVTYRLTDAAVADALIARFRQGVPVRVIIEPEQYMSRTWPEYWLTHANVDRLWLAGIPIRQRAHEGLTHMKMLVTSAYATNASSNIASNWQRDHNLFVSAESRPAIYQAMKQRFEIMWNDPVGFTPFRPLPADGATAESPSASTPLPRGGAVAWRAAPFATSYDIYFGTSPATLTLAGAVNAPLVLSPPATYSWTPPRLLSRTRYYWRIVSRTLAGQSTSSDLWAFTTALWQQPGDFDGDGRTDVGVFRPSANTWYIRTSTSSSTYVWGGSGDVPVPADYDGDGRMDVAVFRPATGTWFIRNSSGLSMSTYVWGGAGDTPVIGDFDGDTRADVAVFRPSTGTWFVRNSSGSPMATYTWGGTADIPVADDYDGDGRPDIAVYRPSNATWYVRNSGGGPMASYVWGGGDDVPVPADYDGDGRVDIAVFRPLTGTWYIRNSTGLPMSVYSWGGTGDVPLTGDFDGDNRIDIAVFRPSTGTWYVRASSGTIVPNVVWGGTGDLPVLKRH